MKNIPNVSKNEKLIAQNIIFLIAWHKIKMTVNATKGIDEISASVHDILRYRFGQQISFVVIFFRGMTTKDVS